MLPGGDSVGLTREHALWGRRVREVRRHELCELTSIVWSRIVEYAWSLDEVGHVESMSSHVDPTRETPTGFRLSHHRESAASHGIQWTRGAQDVPPTLWPFNIVGGSQAGARERFASMISVRGLRTTYSLFPDKLRYRIHQYLNGYSSNGIDGVYCKNYHPNRHRLRLINLD